MALAWTCQFWFSDQMLLSSVYHIHSSGRPVIIESRSYSPPKPSLSAFHILDGIWMSSTDREHSSDIQTILLRSRKLSTRAKYMAKWKHFSLWARSKGYAPSQCSVPIILDCLLFKAFKTFSSVKVHLAVISVFRCPKEGDTFFSPSHKSVNRFIKGLVHIFFLLWERLLQHGT